MLRVPAKIKGLHIKCIKCKWQISDKGMCHLTQKHVSSCPFKSQHRYCLKVCVPNNPGKRVFKILPVDTAFEEAQIELRKFRLELEKNNYKPNSKREAPMTALEDFAVAYLDSLSGTNTLDFLVRKRSKEYVNECRLAIERFMKAIKKKGYPISTFRLDELSDHEVGIYHTYLHKLGLGQRSYNKHMGAMKALVSWAIRVKDQKTINNVFTHVELRTEQKECAIISKEEFTNLLNIITPENGSYLDGVKKRDVYKPWLKTGFRLALETGVRREELVSMRWSNIVDVGTGASVIKLNNLKVNRIANGTDSGRFKYIPLTKSLLRLLEELGYNEKKGTDAFILERPAEFDTRYICDSLSRAFAHYIKQVSERKLQFKCLRKTYITRLTMALGEKTKLFTDHSSDVVLKNHYLSAAFMVGNLSNLEIY